MSHNLVVATETVHLHLCHLHIKSTRILSNSSVTARPLGPLLERLLRFLFRAVNACEFTTIPNRIKMKSISELAELWSVLSLFFQKLDTPCSQLDHRARFWPYQTMFG